jgi:hypothetical protein
VTSHKQALLEAIRQLSPKDLGALRTWFAAFDAEQWDQQFVAQSTLQRYPLVLAFQGNLHNCHGAHTTH